MCVCVSYLLVLLIHSLGQFLLEQHDNLFDVLARHHLQGDPKGLATDIDVRTREHPQDLHGQVIQDTLISHSQLVDTVQHDQFDVVVRLANSQFDQFARRSLDGHGVAGEGRQRGGRFVDHRARRCLQQVEDQTQVFRLDSCQHTVPSSTFCVFSKAAIYLILSVLHRILPDELEFHQLQQFIGIRDAIKRGCQKLQGLLVADRHQRSKRITLAGAVRFGLEEGLDQLRGVRDQVFRVMVDRCHCPHGVLPHIRMSMLQARTGRRQQRFDQFRFPQFAQETQGVASHVFVRVLQVVTDTIAFTHYQISSRPFHHITPLPAHCPQTKAHHLPHQDHLLLQLAVRVQFRTDLVIEIQQLLQWLAPRRHHKPDNMHQQLSHWISIQHDRDDRPHGLQLGLIRALLQLQFQLLQRRLVGRVVLMHQTIRIIQKRRHCGGNSGPS